MPTSGGARGYSLIIVPSASMVMPTIGAIAFVKHTHKRSIRAADAIDPVGHHVIYHCVVANGTHLRAEFDVFQASVDVLLQTQLILDGAQPESLQAPI